MKPEIGQTYERHNLMNGTWHLESRKVLDVTDNSVFYERMYPSPDGTYVESEPERIQVTLTNWQTWVKLARIK